MTKHPVTGNHCMECPIHTYDAANSHSALVPSARHKFIISVDEALATSWDSYYSYSYLEVGMRITSKGQVTIPLEIRRKLGLLANVEVTFEISGNHVKLRKAAASSHRGAELIRRMKGKASPGMTTDQIMALTRG
jgi:AbrB family looped-hinge helix DNA binding protein